MNYEVTLSAAEELVRITVHEPITAELQQAFAFEAITLATKHGIRRYLADVRHAPNVAGTYDQFVLADEDLKRFELAGNSKIAILVRAQDLSHDFIELAFRNSGYECRKFLDEEEALEWLASP